MCLLIAYSRAWNGLPLLLAGNRDELFDRPARPIDQLGVTPLVLGGRDLVAGGTWMAVGEQGVVAALTNRPPKTAGEKPRLRSRGELPLRLVQHESAKKAVEAFVREIKPADYNPCWVLVGDRESLFYLEVWSESGLTARELPAGLHVLENRPLEAPSPKVAFVREKLSRVPRPGKGLLPAIAEVLANPEIPPAAVVAHDPGDWRPPEVEAARVRAGPYGTRWSGIVALGPDRLPPRFCYREIAPQETAYRRAKWPSARRPEAGRSTWDSRT